MSDSTDDNCPPCNDLLPPPPLPRDCKFFFAYKVKLKDLDREMKDVAKIQKKTLEEVRSSYKLPEHTKGTIKELLDKGAEVIRKELVRQVGKLICNDGIDWRGGDVANVKIEFALSLERLMFPDDTEDELCAICLENLDDSPCEVLPCCHTFHGNCICKWRGRKPQCPTCRHPLSP